MPKLQHRIVLFASETLRYFIMIHYTRMKLGGGGKNPISVLTFHHQLC